MIISSYKAYLLFLLCAVANCLMAQVATVTISGSIRDHTSKSSVPYVNAVLKSLPDSTFVAGTITNEQGFFSIAGIPPGNYVLELTNVGYGQKTMPLLVGRLSPFLDLGELVLEERSTTLEEVVIEGTQDAVSETMEKKVFKVEDNISQSGGSLLQVMQNLPGVTITQHGTVQIRGSEKIAVLIDGRQTALTGFGNQRSLENIPASAIERIEVINNPSAKFDANGNAGIINIIFKKNAAEGFNGRVGLSLGLGALWIKKENLAGIRPQYVRTPKINPSIALNYRKKKTNLFLQADNLYTETLNKSEFADRFYNDGQIIRQQLKRNRNTNIITTKGGFDYYPNERNTFTASALFSRESIIDRGDQPFFNGDLTERFRLWQFLEDEVLTATTFSATWQHRYLQPGRQLNLSYNYTFNREDEKYFFTNTLPTYTGEDSFALIADQHVNEPRDQRADEQRRARADENVRTHADWRAGRDRPCERLLHE